MKSKIGYTIAYTSGYIDGDGCFHIRRQLKPDKKYRYQITVSSVNEDILQFFKNEFGGVVFLSNENVRFKNYKPIFQWVIQGRYALSLTEKIIPNLIEKKKEAKIFKDFINEKCKPNKIIFIRKMKKCKFEENLISKDTINILNDVKYKGTESLQDYAYLAGFIDAECSLGISRYKPSGKPNFVYKIMLQCNNTKSPTFFWLKERFGGSFCLNPRGSLSPKWNNQAVWRISGRALSKILFKLSFFLRHKSPVCEKLIEFYRTTLPNGGDRQSESFKQSYAEIISKRESIVNEVHRLNFRGIKHI